MVGLTGGIATGKSTVVQRLTQHDISIIDLDVIARQVVQPGTRTLSQLVSHFGNGILHLEDGTLNRPALAALAFSTPEGRKALNSITHGAIRRAALWLLVRYWITGAKVVVVDTPLLIESGLWRWCGQAVLVYADPETQKQRLLQRDASQGKVGPEAEQDAVNRLRSQVPIDAKKAYVDTVVDNSVDAQEGDRHALHTQVDQLVHSWTKYDQGIGWVRWFCAWVVPPFGLVLALLAVVRRSASVWWKRSSERKNE